MYKMSSLQLVQLIQKLAGAATVGWGANTVSFFSFFVVRALVVSSGNY
jgi:hypothetical protein